MLMATRAKMTARATKPECRGVIHCREITVSFVSDRSSGSSHCLGFVRFVCGCVVFIHQLIMYRLYFNNNACLVNKTLQNSMNEDRVTTSRSAF